MNSPKLWPKFGVRLESLKPRHKSLNSCTNRVSLAQHSSRVWLPGSAACHCPSCGCHAPRPPAPTRAHPGPVGVGGDGCRCRGLAFVAGGWSCGNCPWAMASMVARLHAVVHCARDRARGVICCPRQGPRRLTRGTPGPGRALCGETAGEGWFPRPRQPLGNPLKKRLAGRGEWESPRQMSPSFGHAFGEWAGRTPTGHRWSVPSNLSLMPWPL